MEQLNRFGLESFIKSGAEALFAKDTSSDIVDSVVSQELRTSLNAALGCLKGMWKCNLHDKLHKIKVPTLILVGDRDRATPLQCSETLKKAISDSKLRVIGDCGHMMPVEKPNELNKSLQSFLQTIQPTTD